MRKTILAVGVVIVGIVACGGSITSVDGSKNVPTLSSADANQLCNDTYQYFVSSFSSSDITKVGCGFEAGAQQDPSTCSSTYQTCLSSATTTTIPTTPDCSGFAAEVASCNTTVDTFTQCFKMEISVLKDLEGQMPLCAAGALEAAEIQEDSKFGATCLALSEAGCNFALGFGSSSSSSSGDGG